MHDIKNSDLEIELKIKVNNPTALIEWLNKHAERIHEEQIEDHYLEHKDHPFRFLNQEQLIDASDWLRIRKSTKGNTLNFKKAILNENSEVSYFEETESEIESVDKLLKIFHILNYTEICCYHKTRKVYRYQDFEFDLDLVDELGIFVEIEFVGMIRNLHNGVPIIRNLLKEIGISNYTIINAGYPQIFWNGITHYIEEV